MADDGAIHETCHDLRMLALLPASVLLLAAAGAPTARRRPAPFPEEKSDRGSRN